MTKTKRVRIAVAMDSEGYPWLAYMRNGMTAVEAMRREWPESARFWGGAQFTVVEADVPLPEEPAVVRGEVVDVD